MSAMIGTTCVSKLSMRSTIGAMSWLACLVELDKDVAQFTGIRWRQGVDLLDEIGDRSLLDGLVGQGAELRRSAATIQPER